MNKKNKIEHADAATEIAKALSVMNQVCNRQDNNLRKRDLKQNAK